METQRPVLSEADQLYCERVAADCLDLLGPGMELTGLALDPRRSGHPAAELSPGDDRLDERGPRPDGHRRSRLAARAARARPDPRGRSSTDRTDEVARGTSVAIARRNSCRRRTSTGRPGSDSKWWGHAIRNQNAHGPRNGHPPDRRLWGKRNVVGVTADRSRIRELARTGRRRPRIARRIALRMADAHPAVGVVGQTGGRCQDHGLQARADSVDRRRRLRGHLQGRVVRVIRGVQCEEAERVRDLVVHGGPAEGRRPAGQAQRRPSMCWTRRARPRRTSRPPGRSRTPRSRRSRSRPGRSSPRSGTRADPATSRSTRSPGSSPRATRTQFRLYGVKGCLERFGEDERSALPGRAHEAPRQEPRAHQDGERIHAIDDAQAYDPKARCAVARSGAGRSDFAPSSFAPTTPTANRCSRSSSAKTSATSASTDRRVPVARPTVPCRFRCCRQGRSGRAADAIREIPGLDRPAEGQEHVGRAQFVRADRGRSSVAGHHARTAEEPR